MVPGSNSPSPRAFELTKVFMGNEHGDGVSVSSWRSGYGDGLGVNSQYGDGRGDAPLDAGCGDGHGNSAGDAYRGLDPSWHGTLGCGRLE